MRSATGGWCGHSSIRWTGPQGYWLVTAKGRRESRKLRAFRAWLRREVPASVRGYVYQSRG